MKKKESHFLSLITKKLQLLFGPCTGGLTWQLQAGPTRGLTDLALDSISPFLSLSSCGRGFPSISLFVQVGAIGRAVRLVSLIRRFVVVFDLKARNCMVEFESWSGSGSPWFWVQIVWFVLFFFLQFLCRWAERRSWDLELDDQIEQGRCWPVSSGNDNRVAFPFSAVSTHLIIYQKKKKITHTSKYLYKTCLYLISLVEVSRFDRPKKWKHTQLLQE